MLRDHARASNRRLVDLPPPLSKAIPCCQANQRPQR
jgi:hypothetical protein